MAAWYSLRLAFPTQMTDAFGLVLVWQSGNLSEKEFELRRGSRQWGELMRLPCGVVGEAVASTLWSPLSSLGTSLTEPYAAPAVGALGHVATAHPLSRGATLSQAATPSLFTMTREWIPPAPGGPLHIDDLTSRLAPWSDSTSPARDVALPLPSLPSKVAQTRPRPCTSQRTRSSYPTAQKPEEKQAPPSPTYALPTPPNSPTSLPSHTICLDPTQNSTTSYTCRTSLPTR